MEALSGAVYLNKKRYVYYMRCRLRSVNLHLVLNGLVLSQFFFEFIISLFGQVSEGAVIFFKFWKFSFWLVLIKVIKGVEKTPKSYGLRSLIEQRPFAYYLEQTPGNYCLTKEIDKAKNKFSLSDQKWF